MLTFPGSVKVFVSMDPTDLRKSFTGLWAVTVNVLFIRGKYVSKADRQRPPIIAPLPPRLIPGGYASPELLADIMVKKFNDHIPLYRQEQILRVRHGIELSRKTMCDWLERVAWWVKPIYDRIPGLPFDRHRVPPRTLTE